LIAKTQQYILGDFSYTNQDTSYSASTWSGAGKRNPCACDVCRTLVAAVGVADLEPRQFEVTFTNDGAITLG